MCRDERCFEPVVAGVNSGANNCIVTTLLCRGRKLWVAACSIVCTTVNTASSVCGPGTIAVRCTGWQYWLWMLHAIPNMGLA
jgi:hypothetical protein